MLEWEVCRQAGSEKSWASGEALRACCSGAGLAVGASVQATAKTHGCCDSDLSKHWLEFHCWSWSIDESTQCLCFVMTEVPTNISLAHFRLEKDISHTAKFPPWLYRTWPMRLSSFPQKSVLEYYNLCRASSRQDRRDFVLGRSLSPGYVTGFF